MPSPLPELKDNWLYRYGSDHRLFLSDCVWTQDQADKNMPIKPFPRFEEKPHPYIVSDYIVKEDLFACIKHRRLIITWTCCAIILWDAMFNEGRFNALLSKKEEDSDELVRRCKFIYDNIPADKIPYKPRAEYKYTSLIFKEIDSEIKGFAQGPDQLRQRACSRIVADEFAFWERAQATFVAMKPTIEGGGKITLVSTRYRGFFQDIVEDKLED